MLFFWMSQVVVLDSLPLAGPSAICFVGGHPINPVMKHSLGEGGAGIQQSCHLFTVGAMPGQFICLTRWFRRRGITTEGKPLFQVGQRGGLLASETVTLSLLQIIL